jgi:putative endonuclease
MGAFVYMLRCANGSLYIGSATGDDLLPRVEQHNAGAFREARRGHGGQ